MQKIRKINKYEVMGMILILVSFSFTLKFIYDLNYDKKKTNKIIEEEFSINRIVEENVIEEENEEIDKNNNYEINLTNDYLGYIELKGYGVKRLIVNGTSNNILDKGLVGMLNVSSNLDDEKGNIILAGHNTINNFKPLHYMNIGDEITITTHRKTYNYEIIEKHTINPDDYSYFNQVKDNKILTLITCNYNGKKRLIVVAKLRG